jgi:Fe-Mn family superoxide dismutase
MPEKNFYLLPELPYSYKVLEPYISEGQLRIHHDKHHQGYVSSANMIFEKLEKARKENSDLDIKSTLKTLSFNVGGHILHSLFWSNMAPSGEGGGGKPKEQLAEAIIQEFVSVERFKKEFTEAANSVEGSGWAALTIDENTKRLVIMQIEKHNMNLYPNFQILMVLDVWEHAYYLDYQNLRAKFIEAFWNVVNWSEIEKRFNHIKT